MFNRRTKIFIRYPKTLFKTEDAYQERKNYIASIIQANWKGYQQRKKYIKMRTAVIVVQKYVKRFLALRHARKRREAVKTIRRFIEGFITRDGPVTEINRNFVEIAKKQWLMRLAKSLPQSILYRPWPMCPYTCKEASEHLEKYYGAQLSRKYRLKLTVERKKQFELKVLAESLFDSKFIG